MRTLKVVFALVLVAAMLLTACAPKDTGPAKVATFIFTQELDTLNPLYTNMWFSTITHQIWNCWAWDFDDKAAPRPVLVTEIPSTENGGISPDGKVITLTLRDDLAWSDGEPLTSADFLFTYEMTLDPANAVSTTFPYDVLTSVEAPDPQTVVMTFPEPYAAWVGTMWRGLIPEHVLRPVFEEAGTLDEAEWNRNATVGCGPYALSEWESGSYMRFVTNENYWGEDPLIDEIFVRFVPDDASQTAAMVAGDGDLGTFIAYSDMPALEEAGVKIAMVFSGYNEGMFFCLDAELCHPALQDVSVRKAIAYALDRFSLNEDLLLGLTIPAVTFWDNTPFADPSLEVYPYDPDEAEALLDAAGWVDSNGDGTRDKDGVELVLRFGTTDRQIRLDTQAVWQQNLADVGIGIELFSWDFDTYFASYPDGPTLNGELDLMEWSDSPNYPDPEDPGWMCSEIPTDENPVGVNSTRYCDEELDALFQQQKFQVDFAERQQTFYEISRMVYEKVYWLGIWQDPDAWALSSRLQNVKLSGVSPFYNIAEWDLVTP